MYQRIQDEEDLAATERESDPDDDGEMDLPQEEDSPSKPRKTSSQRSLASKGSTPIGTAVDANKENMLDEQTGSLSEASGLSFLQGLTDQNVAAVMTPHFTNRAKDRKRVQNISSKPIIFNRGPKPSEIAEDARSVANSDHGSNSGRWESRQPLYDPVLNGVNKAFSDTGVEPRTSRTTPGASKRKTPSMTNHQDNSEEELTSDELRAAEKEVQNRKLKRLLSGPKSASTRTEPNNQGEIADNDTRQSVQSDPSPDLAHQSNPIPAKNPVPATAKGMLSMWARKATEQRNQKQSDLSQIDWAGVGADVPVPSVENTSTPQATPPKPESLDSVRSQKSIDRLRRLDNDFTGMSFQVSESPPIRSRRSVEDYVRDKEMDHLNKKALTTNRLGAIREKDPREAHRRLSRSPSAGQLKNQTSVESLSASQQQAQPVGEQVPDTPVVIYRSSSNSSKDGERSLQRPNHDRRASHDQLQRLARAMSTTPRSSPAPTITRDIKGDEVALDFEGDVTQDTNASSNAPELQQEQPQKPSVLETPRVIGAWTDTILPDTVRTAKPTGRKPSRWTQTPLVSAGGWIDTPRVNGNRQSSALAPMTIEEVTVDITSEVPPAEGNKFEKSASTKNQPPPVEVGARSPSQANKRQLPPSILGRVLEDDTFDFGETTMDSLGNLIDDTTKMIDERKAVLTQEQADMMATDELGFIDHLGGKLREVALGLHDTRKGISNLERVFMRASSGAGIEDQNSHYDFDSSIMPVIYSTITLPIPLLFHPRTSAKGQRSSIWVPFGHPTPLGYATLAVWVWYLCECFACELFSHPLHAERYVWPPIDSPEPIFPFVIPTLLLRVSGMNVNFGSADGLLWTIFGPMFVLLRAVYRIVGMWVGWTDGFVDDLGATQAIKNATAAVIHAAKTAAATGLGDDWSMMNDEII